MSEQESDIEKSELVTMLADLDNREASGDKSDVIVPSTVNLPNSKHIEKHLKCSRLLRKIFNAPTQPRSSLAKFRGGSVNIKDAPPEPDEIRGLTQVDRFKIRRMLGSGGCGYVFLAWDPALSRLVALKVPTAETLISADRRARFKQEARAAAVLAHPNIVPVFESGETGFITYICYQFCPGVTLAEWLAKQKQPVAFRLAAGIMIPIAEGVAHAHARGVLHRDLKPGNIILQDIEQSPDVRDLVERNDLLPFVPRITDFGLAKLIGDSQDKATELDGPAKAHSFLTKSQTVMGTPAYMSPEQARGAVHEVTTLGDVYSLGAILYQLLTGQPPFQAATSMETLEMVMNRDPISPGKLRRGIPKDLETICLKCLEKDPSRRYGSALELSEDLRRFNAGESISARPISLFERCSRWCRKNPLSAVLSAIVACMILTAIGAVFWQWRNAEHEALLRQAERDTALKERDRAESNLKLAGDMVDHLLKAGDELAAFTNMTSKRREILEHAQAYYSAFESQSESYDATLESSRMLTRLGRISLSLRQREEAIDALSRALDLLVKLEERFPGQKKTKVERSWVMWNLAITHRENRNLKKASEIYDELIPLYEELIREYPKESIHRSWLANALMNNANYLPLRTPESEGFEKLKRAEKIQRELLAEDPTSVRYRSEMALTMETLGKIDVDFGRDHSAIAYLTQAIDARNRLLVEHPNNDENKEYLSRCLLHRGFAYYRQSEYLAALEDQSRSVELSQALSEKYRDLPTYKDLLARSLLRKGQVLSEIHRYEEAKQTLHRCVNLFGEIAPTRDSRFMFNQQSSAYAILADSYYKLNEYLEAEKWMRKLLALDPKNFTAQYAIATIIRLDPSPISARIAEADSLITQALAQSPRNVPALMTAGEIKYLLGDKKAGHELFGKALVVQPLFRWTNAYSVISTQIRLGEFKHAAYSLQAAVKDSYRVTVEELLAH